MRSPETRRAFLVRAAGASTVAAALVSSSACSFTQTEALARLDQWRRVGSTGTVRRRYDADLGRPVLDITSPEDGSEAGLAIERVSPISLTNQSLKLWLKVDAESAANLAYLVIKVGSGSVPFESLAYQAVLETAGMGLNAYLLSVFKPGEWIPLTLGPASFVGLGQVNFGPVDFDQLQDFEVAVAALDGRHATVSVGGVQVVPGDPRFPHGVVSLTFDDGLSSVHRSALPVLASHGFPATAYLIRDLIEPAGSAGLYLSQSQLTDLAGRGWELAAHANRIADHNAPQGLAGLPPETVIADLRAEVAWLNQSGFNGARDLALPKGYFTRALLDLATRYAGFETIRTADFRTVETLPVADARRLRSRSYDPREQVGPAEKPGTVQWRVDQVARYGGWLILDFHDVGGSQSSPNAAVVNEATLISAADFERIVDHIATRGLPVRTVRDVWRQQGR